MKICIKSFELGSWAALTTSAQRRRIALPPIPFGHPRGRGLAKSSLKPSHDLSCFQQSLLRPVPSQTRFWRGPETDLT